MVLRALVLGRIGNCRIVMLLDTAREKWYILREMQQQISTSSGDQISFYMTITRPEERNIGGYQFLGVSEPLPDVP
jgi:hypothetical protein